MSLTTRQRSNRGQRFPVIVAQNFRHRRSTVKLMVALWLSDPEVPLTVTLAVPMVALPEAVSVRVEVALPFAAGVTGFFENFAVTPLGKPVALSVVAELKLFWLVMVMVLFPLLSRSMVREVGEAPMVKFADPAAALTVRAIVVVAVRLPLLPVMVTVAVPVVAVALAVSVSTLVPVVGFAPNVAVTPLGRPDAASVTLPLNPFWSFTVMVLVPPAPPWVIVRLPGESESVKLGVAGPVRVLISVAPFGLPHPVTRS